MGKTEEKITQRAISGKMTIKEFLYRLFFTREDSLDTLQLLFASIVVMTLIIIWNIVVVVNMSDAVKIESLITLRWLTGLLVITAVPKWLVPFVVKNRVNLPTSNNTPAQTEEPISTEETT